MATIHRKCNDCGKIAEVAAEIKLAFGSFITLKCGHSLILESVKNTAPIELTATSGKSLFPFQAQSIKFMEEAGGVCLVAHEMGLGKTICATGFLGRNRQIALPALVFCKASLKINWFREVLDWVGIVAQIIDKGIEQPHTDIFPVTIMSIDLLRRVTNGGNAWPEEIWSKYKTVIIDECQAIKSPEAQRTKWVREKFASTPYRIALSGTPIKNNAGEYFTVLNLLRPDKFPSLSRFLSLDVTFNGFKAGGLRYPQQFKAKTEDFIIRYERKDVLPDLPSIFRTFRTVEMDDEELIRRYTDTVKEFQDWMDDNEGKLSTTGFTSLLAFFARMRQITGIAKVPAAIDFIEEFLLETDRKLVIFLHHKETANLLVNRLNKTMKDAGMPDVLVYHSGLNSLQRQQVVDDFWKPEHRIMVASTLAAGEGINLQCCSDCLIMERQWNPANEEQAEARFPRPGQTADKINVTYLIALGTIDEFLSDKVEEKRAIVKSTMDHRALTIEESSLMRELADALMSRGLKRWSYK
jgi:SNF2 family DNA or RNA helicase